MLLRCRQVERRDQHAGFLRSKLGEDVAALIADEAVAVEALPALRADTVGGDDGTTFDTAWPIIARRQRRDVSRSGSCGSVPIAVG